MDETEKRHEVQRLYLREGYSQEYARDAAMEIPADRLDEMIELMRPSAMRHPERQILPPGTLDLADVKSQRWEAEMDAEEAERFETRNQFSRMVLQSFTRAEAPTEVLQGLLDAMEVAGTDRLEAMAEIIKEVEFLRKMYEDYKDSIF